MSTQEKKKVSLDELCELERAVLRRFSPKSTKPEVFEVINLRDTVANSSEGKICLNEAGIAIDILKNWVVLVEVKIIGSDGFKYGVMLSEKGKELRSSLSDKDDTNAHLLRIASPRHT